MRLLAVPLDEIFGETSLIWLINDSFFAFIKLSATRHKNRPECFCYSLTIFSKLRCHKVSISLSRARLDPPVLDSGGASISNSSSGTWGSFLPGKLACASCNALGWDQGGGIPAGFQFCFDPSKASESAFPTASLLVRCCLAARWA